MCIVGWRVIRCRLRLSGGGACPRRLNDHTRLLRGPALVTVTQATDKPVAADTLGQNGTRGSGITSSYQKEENEET